MRRGLLLVHPRAQNHKEFDQLVGSLSSQFDLIIEQSLYPGHTREHARNYLSNFEGIVFSAGGDGTFHEAVNGWADAGFPPGPRFCPLPLGTGNDFLYSTNIKLSKPSTYLKYPLSQVTSADLAKFIIRL